MLGGQWVGGRVESVLAKMVRVEIETLIQPEFEDEAQMKE
jgi:hypothetical protein